MAFQVSPGINFTEKDLTTVVPNVSTNIGAFVGTFQWGPISYRTSITTENDLVELFGKPTASTATHFWSAANYLAYSNNLVVVGVKGTGYLNAVVGDGDAGQAIAVDNSDHYDDRLAAGAFTDQLFIAKYPGVRGSSLKVKAIDSNAWDNGTSSAENLDFLANFESGPLTSADVAAAGGSQDEMHILVYDEDGLFTGVPGEIIEKWGYVSKAIDAKRHDGSSNYVGDVLKNESKYIYLGDAQEFAAQSSGTIVHAGVTKSGTTFSTWDGSTASEGAPGGSLTGGNDGAAMTAAPLILGWAYFNTAETSDVTLLIAGPGGTDTDRTVQQTVIGIAETRKDCIAFVSPAMNSVVHSGSNQTDDIVADKTGMNASNSYGVMDGAWKYQYCRYQDKFMYVPMNGDIAGLCARLDFTHDAWWSPAGMNRGAIKNIVKLSWEPTKADRDTMYKAGINPLITQTGAGVLLWGDRTMQPTPTAFDRINVRRLFIVMEKAISNAAKSMLFEFNDEFTRSQFVNMVEPFLREIQGRRGITDFKVVCDGSNNSGVVIDNNQFVGDIYVKPTRSINYIQLNFIAARTDVNFTEIGG
jgi:phage tail sheath protein FI